MSAGRFTDKVVPSANIPPLPPTHIETLELVSTSGVPGFCGNTREYSTAMTMASCSPSLRKAAESIRTLAQFSYPHHPRQLASIPSPAVPQPYPRKHPVAFASRKVITRPHRSTNVLYDMAATSSTADPRSLNGWPQVAQTPLHYLDSHLNLQIALPS